MHISDPIMPSNKDSMFDDIFIPPPDESCFFKKTPPDFTRRRKDRNLMCLGGSDTLVAAAACSPPGPTSAARSQSPPSASGEGEEDERRLHSCGKSSSRWVWLCLCLGVVTVVVAVAGSRRRRRNVCWYWTTLSMFDEMSIDVLLCTTEEKEEDYVHRSSAKLKKILCTLGHSSGVLLFLKQFRLMKKPKKILCTDKLLCKNAKAAEFEF
jgi:hypothetical protein